MKSIILFDIDGTILRLKKWKSKEIFAKLFLELFDCEVPHHHLPSFSGMTDLQILFEISENCGIDKNKVFENLDLIWDKIYEDFIPLCCKENIELLPGIEELILRLHSDENFQLGLLTGNFKRNAYLKLKVYELDKYFPEGAFGDDDKDRNKLPQIAYNRIIKDKINSYNFEKTIIIGDSPRDIECAHKSGLNAIAVATGDNSVEHLAQFKPELIYKNFIETNKIIEDIYNLN
jgi:phosphoglycolate phosphatase